MKIANGLRTEVPACRLRLVNSRGFQPSDLTTGLNLADRRWVVYWMTAFRRTRFNYALQFARDLAKHHAKPLVLLDALRVRYRWASDRMHQFIIEGMRDNAAACEDASVLYYPYVEPQPGAGSGLVEELARASVAVVTDDFPCFFHPRLLRIASRKLNAPLVAVDSNCLMPLAHPDREFTVAHSYRRYMQKELLPHLESFPDANPLDGRSTRTLPLPDELPRSIRARWPASKIEQLLATESNQKDGSGLVHLPIDHAVRPVSYQGGAVAAEKLLDRFLRHRLSDYDDARNEPDEQGSSELSPYLHFGHISPHEIFSRLMEQSAWHPGKVAKPNGKLNGFWNVSPDAEAFLDQLCTWREIGFIKCWQDPDYDRYESLPAWAQQTLDEHADDPRPYEYTLEQFERAETHDSVWNAAQRQLVREGHIHNYLRMLWGKKILHWTPSPRRALEIMVHLNNKYGIDGRDPNSYSGIFWVLGRFDRAWGPERPIFGKVRYMTSENMAKKHSLEGYLHRYATF